VRVALVLLAAVVGLSADAAAAEAPAPFQLRPAPVSLGWDALQRGVTVTLVNDTAARQQPEFVFGGFATAAGQLLCPDGECLTGELREGDVLTAGAEGEAVLRGTGSPADGRYAGTVAILDSTTGAFARVPVEIVVPAVPALVAATPLGDKASTTIDCSLTHHSCTEGRSVWIELGVDIDPGAGGDKLDLEPGPVGAVSSDDDTAAVRYTGRTRTAAEGGPAVELVIDEPAAPATYEGSVDLLPDDEDAGDVALEVTVRTEWGWFLLAIALGVAFAAGTLWFVVGNKLVQLRRRLVEALTAVDDAKLTFATGGRPWSLEYDLTAFPADAKAIEDGIRAARSVHWTDLPKEKAETFGKAIDAVAAGAAGLSGLDADLVGLDAKLREVASRCRPVPVWVPAGEPPLAARARELYRDQTLTTMKELADRREELGAWMTFIRAWRGFECDVAALWARVRPFTTLPKRALLDQGQITSLDELEESVRRAFHLLWGCDDADALSQADVPEELRKIRLLVADVERAPVGAPPQVWQPTPGAAAPVEAARDVARRVAAGARAGRWVLVAAALAAIVGVLAFSTLNAESPQGAVDDADFPLVPVLLGGLVVAGIAVVARWLYRRDLSRRDQARRLWWQELARTAILSGVALALALVTALNALYVDKPWGSYGDYVNAFLWGTTARAALDLLFLPALEQLAGLRPFAGLLGRR